MKGEGTINYKQGNNEAQVLLGGNGRMTGRESGEWEGKQHGRRGKITLHILE